MSTVTTQFDGTIAVLRLNNPPLNMGNAALRSDILEAIEDLGKHATVEGVVIVSELANFYAGSDIKEFAGELSDPQLPELIDAIEKLPVPVIAAMTGLALGGGLEFALGCDRRIGDPSVQVGFPEVTLGMVPGAGGTVRTPRLTGTVTAIDLVGSARQIDADEARRVGILDVIVPAEHLLEMAVALARSASGKSRTIDRTVPSASDLDVEQVVEKISRSARPNVIEALNLVRRAGEGNVYEALATEREAFTRLRQSDEAGNLRYLFFARRAAAKALRSPEMPKHIQTVGIAGAGTMGASLAKAFADKGLSVVVFDRDLAARKRLVSTMPEAQIVPDIAGLAEADLIIDAVFEDMAVKTDLLRELEPVLRDDTVIVSNTSYLNLDEMSGALKMPNRFAGLHFFNPPHRNPLVELIRTPHTDEVTAATLAKIISTLGKVGIPAAIGDGFVANRVYSDYRTQAEFLVEEGASPSDVDCAMRDLGLPIGPFAVADMSGLDIAWARRKRLAASRDPRQRYVRIPDTLCETGRLGQKTGAGWYRYPEGSRRGEPDPTVNEIISNARADNGIVPRHIDSAEIQNRILASMVCASATLLDAGIAGRASDIDVAMTEGFAFPRQLGGPVRAFAAKTDTEIIAALTAVHRSCPVTFSLAEPATLGVVPATVARCLDAVREKPVREKPVREKH